MPRPAAGEVVGVTLDLWLHILALSNTQHFIMQKKYIYILVLVLLVVV